MKPPQYLKAGDVVTLGIQGLGGAAAEGGRIQGKALVASIPEVIVAGGATAHLDAPLTAIA
jgi:hypothetical protein